MTRTTSIFIAPDGHISITKTEEGLPDDDERLDDAIRAIKRIRRRIRKSTPTEE